MTFENELQELCEKHGYEIISNNNIGSSPSDRDNDDYRFISIANKKMEMKPIGATFQNGPKENFISSSVPAFINNSGIKEEDRVSAFFFISKK